jgi:hypothetical protein
MSQLAHSAKGSVFLAMWTRAKGTRRLRGDDFDAPHGMPTCAGQTLRDLHVTNICDGNNDMRRAEPSWDP